VLEGFPSCLDINIGLGDLESMIQRRSSIVYYYVFDTVYLEYVWDFLSCIFALLDIEILILP